MKNIQLPTTTQKIALKIIQAIALFIGFFTLLGLMLKDTEMMTVCGIITFSFVLLSYFIQRKYNNYYEEDENQFSLEGHVHTTIYQQHLVKYEDISAVTLGRKKIGILDGSTPEKNTIWIQLAYAEPHLLLRKITQMMDENKFKRADESTLESSQRQQEWVDFLIKNKYDAILEDYFKDISQ